MQRECFRVSVRVRVPGFDAPTPGLGVLRHDNLATQAIKLRSPTQRVNFHQIPNRQTVLVRGRCLPRMPHLHLIALHPCLHLLAFRLECGRARERQRGSGLRAWR